MYDRAEAGFAASPASVANQRLLNFVSDEAANSAYLANALDGDGDPSESFTEDELREPSMQSELSHFGEDLVNRWVGALYALSPQNPDAARHFCTSAREVVISVLDMSAPDADVRRQNPSCQLTETGAVTRRSKIAYLLQRQGVTTQGITDAVSGDVDDLLSLLAPSTRAPTGTRGASTSPSCQRSELASSLQFGFFMGWWQRRRDESDSRVAHAGTSGIWCGGA